MAPPQFYDVGATKTVAFAPAKEGTRRSSTKPPPRKKAKIEILDDTYDVFNRSARPSVATRSSSVSIDSDAEPHEEFSQSILSTINTVTSLLNASGRVQKRLIERYLSTIKKQVKEQDKEIADLAKKAQSLKKLAQSREEQIDKMSTYMWPKQLMDMWGDDREELIKEDMMKQRKKDNAKFERLFKAGKVSMPEKPTQRKKQWRG